MMFMGLRGAACNLDSDCANGQTCNAATGQCEDVQTYCPYGIDLNTGQCFSSPQSGSSPSASPVATNCAYGINLNTGQCYSAPQSPAPTTTSMFPSNIFAPASALPNSPATAAAVSSVTTFLPVLVGGALVLGLLVLIGKRKSQPKAST